MKTIKTLVLLLAIFSLSACTKNSISQCDLNVDNTVPTFFYKPACQYCQQVEKYFADNQTTNVKKIDVEGAVCSQELFAVVATNCAIPKADWGVPLLIYDDQCYRGSEEIINFFGGLK